MRKGFNRLRNRVAYFLSACVFAVFATDTYVDAYARVLETGQDVLDVELGDSEVLSW